MVELMPELYQNLLSLCSSTTAFYYKDATLDSIKYRVFNYRLCSYEQFHKYPSALNCRGAMFNITNPANIQLVCLPPEKFFNYEEGDGAKLHPLGVFGIQMEKLDGSLISTFLHTDTNNEQVLRLKSKTSLVSSQAREAIDLLTGQYRNEVDEIVRRNYTVNFEYTSPVNQIVLFYPQSKLSVLSIRSHATGDTLLGDRLIAFLKENHFLTILENVVSFQSIPSSITHDKLVADIRAEMEGEGYVIEIIAPDQRMYLIKIKTNRYLTLHHTKSNFNSPRQLCLCVINEQSDDLRSLFQDNKESLERIKKMEEQVQPIFNRMVQSVQEFHQDNKHLPRKEFALKVINIPDMKKYMPLLMNLYQEKEIDYKKFAIQHLKELFHIQDDENANQIANAEQDE